MPSRFLSDEQRARYGRYTGDPTEEQLARHFHLDATDHELVGQMRGAHNRVGFAVQLGTARFLGAFLDDPTHAPFLVTATIARQLSEVPAPSLDAYRDGRQRWRHIAIIRERYGFRDLEEDAAAGFRLTRWLYVLCWTGDNRPGLLFDRATTWLLAHKVLLPGITTLERLISRVRYRATLRLWHRLTCALTDTQRQKLTALVASEGATLATLEDLRAAPRRRSPTELLRHLERIDAIRDHSPSMLPPADVPAAPLARLARSARTLQAGQSGRVARSTAHGHPRGLVPDPRSRSARRCGRALRRAGNRYLRPCRRSTPQIQVALAARSRCRSYRAA
jgi:hypothetical protein